MQSRLKLSHTFTLIIFVVQNVECQELPYRSGSLVATKLILGSFHGRHTSALQGTSVGVSWSAGGMWPLQHTAFTGDMHSTAIMKIHLHDTWLRMFQLFSPVNYF